MKSIIAKAIAATAIILASTILVEAESKVTEKKTIYQCLGKSMAEYTAVLGEPVVNDSKQKGYVRLIHTYKTEAISSLGVHQLPEYSVPVWVTITFKDTPKTWQEAFKLAGLPTEGITAKMHSTGGAVLEGFKSMDGKLWAVEFDPTKEQLNAPCHIEIQPKNMDDYKK
jgi:hypothetical protein